MFGVDDKKFSDMEVAQAYWESMKDRMAWCRDAATDYLKENERRRFYKLTYSVDPGEKVAYVSISNGVLQEVEEALKKEFAENGPFNNDDEKYEFYSKVITDILCDYVPERDQHWAGGAPIVTDFDRNEFIYCTSFKVMQISIIVWMIFVNYRITITSSSCRKSMRQPRLSSTARARMSYPSP